MEEPVEKDQPNQVVGNLKQDLLNIQANQDKIRTKYLLLSSAIGFLSLQWHCILKPVRWKVVHYKKIMYMYIHISSKTKSLNLHSDPVSWLFCLLTANLRSLSITKGISISVSGFRELFTVGMIHCKYKQINSSNSDFYQSYKNSWSKVKVKGSFVGQKVGNINFIL